jgi:hypothetical protein
VANHSMRDPSAWKGGGPVRHTTKWDPLLQQHVSKDQPSARESQVVMRYSEGRTGLFDLRTGDALFLRL